MGKDDYVEKQRLKAQLKEVESKRRKLDEEQKRIVDQLDAVNKRLDAVNKHITEKEAFQQAANDMSGVSGTALVKGIDNLILDSEK